MMDEARFKSLARRAKLLTSDYGSGYQRGLRRHYHGAKFGTPAEHAKWMRLGLDGDPREELGRGYRDGFAGREPEPLMGRPPLPDGEGKTARVEWRTTDARKSRAVELAAAAGQSLSAWLDALLEQGFTADQLPSASGTLYKSLKRADLVGTDPSSAARQRPLQRAVRWRRRKDERPTERTSRILGETGSLAKGESLCETLDATSGIAHEQASRLQRQIVGMV